MDSVPEAPLSQAAGEPSSTGMHMSVAEHLPAARPLAYGPCVPPSSIVTAVATDIRGHVTLERSCGHPLGYAGRNTPRVGDRSDCLTCWCAQLEHEQAAAA